MRRLIRLVFLLVILAVIGVGVAVWQIDRVAKAGIESGATYALGVPTTTQSVSVSILGGKVGVTSLNIANPQGYNSAHLLNTGQLNVAADTGSLLTDTVHVSLIELNDVSLHIEQQGGKTNIKVISENLAKLSDPNAPPKDAEGKRFKVDRVVVRNVTANVQVLPLGGVVGQASTVAIKVPEIELNDVTKDNAQGVALSELARRIVPVILASVLKNGKGTIPDDLLKGLNSDVGQLVGELGGGAQEMVGQVADEAMKQVMGEVQKATEGIKDQAGKAVEDVGKKIGDLLGGKKD